MTSESSKIRPGRGDVLLGIMAVIGLLLYALLLPSQHPDAAGDYRPGPDAAVAAAGAFLTANGFITEGLAVDPRLRRQTDLIKALQDSLGRRETVALLQTEDARRLPAYYWHVRYAKPIDQDHSEDGFRVGDETVMSIDLTREGTVWALNVSDRDRLPDTFVNHEALAAAWSGDRLDEGRGTTAWKTLPDSLLTRALRFDFAPVSTAADTTVVPGETAVLETLRAGGDVSLDAGAALALARHHLAHTLLEGLDLRVDSAWVLPQRAGQVAQVRLATTTPLHGQHLRADVAVTATGALQRLDVSFNPDVDEKTNVLAIVAGSLKAGLYVLLILILLVTFFRRMMARLIDVKAALVDALVFGLFFGLFIALSRDFIFDDTGIALWLRLLLGVFIVSLGVGVAALFFFMISSATDSLARSVWSKKVLTASLLRQGVVRNTLVGAALLRGVALAGGLLGVLAVLLAALPGVHLELLDRFLSETALQPLLWAAMLKAEFSYLMTLLVLLGVGTFAYRLSTRGWVVVGAMTVALALIQATPAELEAGWAAWGLSAAFGAVIALAFWRFDLVTCFVGVFLTELVWNFSDGWLMAGSPVSLDLLLLGGGIVGLLVLGFVGVTSRRSGRDVPEYVPAYIEEMAAQERMKRELEIAHQVQEYFLPRVMPRVEGLDVAGMCLPALEVGGDYYDFVELAPGRLAIVVGDVSGKGIEAAFYMTLTKGFLRTLCRELDSPAEVLRRLNTLFCENVPRGIFISMIYGVVDVAERTFTFARAGHNPVILKRSPSQEADLIQPAGIGIGLVSGPLFDETIEERQLSLRPGDVLVFYTDGFSEAMNGVRDQYGDDRLAHKVGRVGKRSAPEILRRVTEDVHHFIDGAGRHDDMTMVVIKLDPGVMPAPAVLDADRVAHSL